MAKPNKPFSFCADYLLNNRKKPKEGLRLKKDRRNCFQWKNPDLVDGFNSSNCQPKIISVLFRVSFFNVEWAKYGKIQFSLFISHRECSEHWMRHTALLSPVNNVNILSRHSMLQNTSHLYHQSRTNWNKMDGHRTFIHHF